MNGSTIGERMKKGKEQAYKSLILLAGILVYVAGVIYAEVHGYSLLIKGVDPEFQMWTTVGIVALGITALVLPAGLHFTFHAPMQRLAAFAFYAIDFALLILNAVLDFNTRAGTANLPGWMMSYMEYILPVTPIIAMLGWTSMFLLDPSAMERATIESFNAAVRETMRDKISEAAKSQEVDNRVGETAIQVVDDVLEQLLSQSLSNARRALPPSPTKIKPKQIIDGKATDTKPENNQKIRHIFSGFMKRGRAVAYAQTVKAEPAQTQEQPVNPTSQPRDQ